MKRTRMLGPIGFLTVSLFPSRVFVFRLLRFYFAIPPNVFLETAASIKQVGISATGFTRLVVEKRELLLKSREA